MIDPIELLAQGITSKKPTISADAVRQATSGALSDQDIRIIQQYGVTSSELVESVADSVAVNYERVGLYKEIDNAIMHPLVGSAAELYADISCPYSPLQNATVWPTGDSKYVSEIEKLFDQINLEERIFDWAWSTATYGDLIPKINAHPGLGVISIDDSFNPVDVSRIDVNGVLVGWFNTPLGDVSGQSSQEMQAPWDYVHFRILGAKRKRSVYGETQANDYRTTYLISKDSKRITSKYGTSVLINALPIYKRLRLCEDSLMMARITRSVLHYMYKLGVSGDNVEATATMIDQYKSILKTARAFDTSASGGMSARYDPLCLRGNTEIRLCNGASVTIREIAENKSSYVGKYVWTINESTKKIEANRILEASKTRLNAKMVRVTLDNGEHVDCTPDHRFMLRNGEYVEAQYLLPQTSLMPFYSRIANEHLIGYEQVYSPGEERYCYAHRRAFFAKGGIRGKKGNVIHHVDFNKLNNDPGNLNEMGSKDHWKYHAEHAFNNYSQNVAKGKSIEELYGKERADEIKRNRSNSLRRSEKKKKYHDSIRGKSLEQRFGVDKATDIKRRIGKNSKGSVYLSKWRNNPDNVDKIAEARKKAGKANSKHYAEIKEREIVCMQTRFCSCGCGEQFKAVLPTNRRFVHCGHARIGKNNAIMSRIKCVESKTGIMAEVRECECGCGEVFVCGINSDRRFISKTHKNNKLVLNHKVVSVEWLPEVEDTYDIQVENNNNFSLTAGIFVHNSALNDVIVPVWGEVGNLAVEELGGKPDIKWIVDVEELRSQLACALRVPLPLLGGYTEEASGALGSSSMEQLDIRFSRSCRRIQRALLDGLTRLCQIHFAYMGMSPDLKLFTLHMPETSTAEEEMLKKALDTGMDVIAKVMDVLDTVDPSINKVEVFSYLNEKILKLNDFDLAGFMKAKKVTEAQIAEMKDQTLAVFIKEARDYMLGIKKERRPRYLPGDTRAALPTKEGLKKLSESKEKFNKKMLNEDWYTKHGKTKIKVKKQAKK